MDAIAVGRLLLVVRLRKGVRQVDLANLAHLSPSAISRHEHGRFTSVRR